MMRHLLTITATVVALAGGLAVGTASVAAAKAPTVHSTVQAGGQIIPCGTINCWEW